MNNENARLDQYSSETTSPDETKLARMVELARIGNTAAFDVLYQAYYAPINRHLIHMVGNEEDALDLTAETFLKAWRNLISLNNEQHFRAWLFRIATNTALDHLRSRKSLMIHQEFLNEDYPQKNVASMEDTVEELELVRLALGEVPPMHRSCLLLEIEGFNQTEIADLMGLTTKSVATYVSRAQQEFRQAYHRLTRLTEKESEKSNMRIRHIKAPRETTASANQLQARGQIATYVPHLKHPDQPEPLSEPKEQKVTESKQERHPDIDDKHIDILPEVAAFVDKLREPYQTPIRLHYEHLTVAEIANQLKRPKGTVKSLLSRGKKMLRRVIEQKDVRSESSEQAKIKTKYEILQTEVAARVCELPERYRQAVYLKYVENLTYPEIAERLNLPKGTVKSLVSRGKKMLFGEQIENSK